MVSEKYVIKKLPHDDFVITDTINNNDIRNKGIVDLLNKQERELQRKYLYDDEIKEISILNNIYEEQGFDGVIDYAKVKLYNCGAVKERNGLIMMATGGWSENEEFLDCLNHMMSNFGRKHYVGYLRGGAFYYSKEEHNCDTEIVNLKEKSLD